MKKLKIIIFLFSSLNVFAQGSDIQKNKQVDTEIFIPIEKSNLYARIVGNPDKEIIITLHGGPGAFNVDHEFFRNIFEQDYLMVYFDQRGSGKSDEWKDKSMLTTDQFVRDLDLVVDYIKNKYPNKKINLLGSSWGGMYGFLYLIKHQEKINSFISNSGTANIKHNSLALIKHERKLAKNLIKKTNDTVKLNRYKEILKELDVIPKDLGFDVYWAQPEKKAAKDKIFNDPEFYTRVKYTPELLEQAMTRFEYINEVFHGQEAYNNLNILNELAVIKTPILVIQGDLDYAIGIESGKMIYKALKNVPKKDKELVYIKNASHNVPAEEPEQLYKALTAFFAKHN